MARPKKNGLDYFSHDVDMIHDRKIRLIKAKYGLLGYAVYIRLLEELYGETGYYLQLDEEFNLLFCDDNGIDVNVYNNMVNDYINYGLFNQKLYNRHHILTSRRIQENYQSATKRRENGSILDEYNIVNVDNNSVNVCKNSTKESKVKNSKEKKRKHIPPYRKFAHLSLSQKEFDKLIADGYTKDEIDNTLDSIQNYRKNTNYKSLNLTLRKWIKRDRDKNGSKDDIADYLFRGEL